MKRIRILTTSDVHGHIFPQRYADGMAENSGFARICTAIRTLRDENTLVLDNGDTLQGTPLSFYHQMMCPDDLPPVTAAMNDIEYDYVNIGNHDFDYGEEILMMHLQNLKAPCITGNWNYHGRPYGPTYVIRETAGRKIAIFALVTSAAAQLGKKSFFRHSHISDAVETARRTVRTIQRLEKPDFIICLYHGGFEKDPVTGEPMDGIPGENQAYRLCKEISGIDLLITGHQHRSMCGTLFGTVYLQTAADGREIGCTDIFPKSGKIESRILKCDMPADETLLSHVQREEDACRSWLDKPIGTASADLSAPLSAEMRIRKPLIVTCFNRTVMAFTHSDLAASSLPLQAPGLSRDITMRDLLLTFPYPDSISVRRISGAVLRLYLEKAAENITLLPDGKPGYQTLYRTPQQAAARFDMLDGCEYTIDLSREPGQRITSLRHQGQEITDDAEFTIALSGFRAAGGQDYSMLSSLPSVREYALCPAELMASVILQNPDLSCEPSGNMTLIY